MNDLGKVNGERQQLAVNWHGGQASMLYAIASTGALTRGTVRPYAVETDDEWDAYLIDGLALELRECVRMAENDDEYADLDALRGWLAEVDA